MARILLLAAVLALAAPALHAQDAAGLADAAAVLAGQTRLVAADGVAQDRFGYSVAVSGTHALVGAYNRESGRGAAYAFEFENGAWVPKNTLRANDGAAGDQFGWAVAISGDRAIVTAKNDDSRGSAYAFAWTGAAWAQRAKLVPQGTLDGAFGYAVSMSGPRAIIGMSSDVGTIIRGSAFVYLATGTTWTQQAQIFASDGAPGDNFGFAVAISGDRALVGAFRQNVQRGAAYFYDLTGTTWTQRQRVAPTDTTGDRYGRSVALDGDRALVGADDGVNGANHGGKVFAYRYTGTTWAFDQLLLPSDRVRQYVDRPEERFGGSVALSGDRAVVGAPFAHVDPAMLSTPERGAMYVFAYTDRWRSTEKVVPSDWQSGDRFGDAVALAGTAAVAGAWPRDGAQGAAYVVGVATETAIAVNETGDAADPNPADGRCDTDAGAAGEQCTLRGAIQTANAVAGDDRITFDFSAARGTRGGVDTIVLTAPLPAVTEPVTLGVSAVRGAASGDAFGDAFGVAVGGAPLVVVDGGGTVETGLTLAAGGSTVRGMAFVGFTGAAIRIEGPGRNTVAGTYIGVDPDGTTLRGNQIGVRIVDSRGNTIGGPTAADRNVIGVPPSPAGTPVGALATGITVEGDASDVTVITGNYIGVAANGAAMLADPSALRSGIGILILGADSTLVGGAASAPGQAPGNVISGLSIGVVVSNVEGEAATAAAFDTRILGNLIGTNAVGADSLSNGTGVLLFGGSFLTRVGSASIAEGNVISGNQVAGIQMTDGGSVAAEGTPPIAPIGTRIVGNTIGLTADGLAPLGNLIGVAAGGERMPNGMQSPGVRGVEIGAPGYPRNLIAGNRQIQIFVFGAGYPDYADPGSTPEQFALSYILIRNNYVGLRADGQPAATGDDRPPVGVFVTGGSRAVVGYENGRNVIGGNLVGLFLASRRNLVYSNYIGTDPSGVSARPNRYGLILTGGDNVIGRPPEDGQVYTGAYILRWGNLVSGNDYAGMALAPGIPAPIPDGLAARFGASARGDGGGPAFLIGNRVGVSAMGAALPNGTGFEPDPQTPEVEVGGGIYAVRGASYLLWNVIAGNVGDGLAVYDTALPDGVPGATTHLIGNAIGVAFTAGGAADVSDLPNTRDGIFVLGGDVRVGLEPTGGTFPDPGDDGRNLVWNSGRNGITTAGFGRLFVTNGSFLGNAGLGIDAGIAGPDGPGVPTGFLLPPVLRVPTLVIDPASQDTTLHIPFRTPPATEAGGTVQHRVELYLSGSCDASGYGEGLVSTFGATTTPATDASVDIVLADAAQLRRLAQSGGFLTATVTQVLAPSGGLPLRYRTSEFSECVRFALSTDVAEGSLGDGQTGPVLPGGNGLGVTATANPAQQTPPARSPARHAAGTLTAARFMLGPQPAVFAGSATAPDGTTVTPTGVSTNRYWALWSDGLDAITYTACLDIAGVSGVAVPAQLLVATRPRPGTPWTPRASTLDGSRLCAAGLTGFGELAIAADTAVNPVPDEPGVAPDVPAAFALAVWPNPAQGAATVTLAVPASALVRVEAFDALGRRVAVLHDGPVTAGTHALRLDASRLPAGVYVVRATSGTVVATRRITVVR